MPRENRKKRQKWRPAIPARGMGEYFDYWCSVCSHWEVLLIGRFRLHSRNLSPGYWTGISVNNRQCPPKPRIYGGISPILVSGTKGYWQTDLPSLKQQCWYAQSATVIFFGFLYIWFRIHANHFVWEPFSCGEAYVGAKSGCMGIKNWSIASCAPGPAWT